MRVLWTNQAQDDALHHAAYVGQFNPAAGARVFRRLKGASLKLLHFPRRGRALPNGWRELTLVPPFIIVYRVDEGANAIFILRVWHGAQDRANNEDDGGNAVTD